jgi:hypothetical protein
MLTSNSPLPPILGIVFRTSLLPNSHSNDLLNLVGSIDELLTSLTQVDYKYEMEKLMKAKRPDPLSKDELKHRIADILSKGSKMKALASPISQTTTAGAIEATGKKTSRGHHGSFILPTQHSLASSSTTSAPTSSSSVPILQTPKTHLEGLTSLRLLCARLHFMGHLKYQLWRIISNIQNEKIESFEELENSHELEVDDDEDNGDDDAGDERIAFTSSSRRRSTADSVLFQLKHLPFVPLSSEIASWNPLPLQTQAHVPSSHTEDDQSHSSSTSKVQKPSSGLLYSIHGLGIFLVKFQRLYYLFMQVRLQFQENQDQNAIMKSASFLESLDIFTKEYKIALDSNLLMTKLGKPKVTTKEVTNDRLDMAVTSFINLPEWICSRYTLSFPLSLPLTFFIFSVRQSIVDVCQQMKDEALYARDSSMITEFHKRLVVRPPSLLSLHLE